MSLLGGKQQIEAKGVAAAEEQEEEEALAAAMAGLKDLIRLS